MKAPIEERFEVKDGKAHWKNRSEQGEQAVTGEASYVPANAPPEFAGVLFARAAQSARPQAARGTQRRSLAK